jgi:hypothetical protein
VALTGESVSVEESRLSSDSEDTHSDPTDHLIDSATKDGLLGRYGSDWVTGLPELMARLAEDNRWKIIKRLVGGRTACVLIVEAHGRRVVVKVTPDIERSSRELAALGVLSQHAIGPRVLERWIDSRGPGESSVAVLELIGDGQSIRDTPSVRVPPKEGARLLMEVAICGTIPLPVSLQSLESHLIWRLEKSLGGGLHGAPPATASELEQARRILADLIDSTPDGTWVHGTLHPGNLIAHHGKIWTIDPRPFQGDGAYDVAELALKWGSEREGRAHNLADGLAMLEDLGQHCEFDEQRVLSWMQVIFATGV